jgi:hypothetical protein
MYLAGVKVGFKEVPIIAFQFFFMLFGLLFGVLERLPYPQEVFGAAVFGPEVGLDLERLEVLLLPGCIFLEDRFDESIVG